MELMHLQRTALPSFVPRQSAALDTCAWDTCAWGWLDMESGEKAEGVSEALHLDLPEILIFSRVRNLSA